MGNWLQLRSGGGYDFDEGRIFGPFTMENDLAMPLSIPRYGMHADIPWPVNLHSVAVARTIEAVTGNLDGAAAGILHDGHEAIIGDIMTPVAWAIDYEKIKALKAEVQSAIHFKLGIPERYWPEHYKEWVDAADQAALYIERRRWMLPEPRDWHCPVPEHKWLVAMHKEVDALLAGSRQNSESDVFIVEYNRLITDRRKVTVN